MNSDAGKETAPDDFSEEDLQLGKNASKFVSVLCVIAFVARVGIAIFVFMNVPWDTRMPYDGQYNRSGNGIPMQSAMLISLVVLFLF